MATLYYRIHDGSEKLMLHNYSSDGNILRDGSHIACFKIADDQYDDGDDIQIRIEGAQYILQCRIEDTTDFTEIAMDSSAAYTKTTGDMSGGIYIKTVAIATAVELNVFIVYTIETGEEVVYATLEAS